MLQRQAFLEAIVAEPQDDATRLVFADWLEEQGDADRAAFIRAQVERARLAEDDPRQEDLAGREGELLARRGAEWLAELPGPLRRDAEFRRGFVARLRCTAGEFLAGLPALARSVPLEELALTGLEAGPAEGTREARRLARLPAFPSLSALDLSGNRLGPQHFLMLPYAARLPRLTRLDLSRTGLGDAGVRFLAGVSLLGRLTALRLRGNGVTDAGVAALARSPFLSRLRLLDLDDNAVANVGAAALAASLSLGRLRALSLRSNSVGDAGATALAASPRLPSLAALDLAFNRIGQEGALALAQSPHLSRLESLHLSGNRLGELARLALSGRRLGQVFL
jgi:uncharacterized protein (TIGR02996 family)